MAITQSDVRLYASERMTDFADGGGRMSTTVIVDGQDNNVFDDVSDFDRVAGRVNARKVFGAVTSATADTYMSAHAMLADGPDDAAIDALLIAYGDLATERAALAEALAPAAADRRAFALSTVAAVVGGTQYDTLAADAVSGSDVITFGASAAVLGLVAGQTVSLTYGTASAAGGGVAVMRTVLAIDAVSASPSVRVQLDATMPTTATVWVRAPVQTSPRAYGVAICAGGAGAGASSITVDRVWARIVPVDLAAAYPAAALPQWLVPLAWPYAVTHGQVQVIQAADALLVHHTASMAPAAVANGQTVSTGRTGLARLRVIGNNGVEHARFTVGVSPPGGVGCTADLAAGSVTFTNVAGMSQPVTVEHRIEEMAMASAVRVGAGVITLNRALSRAFPAGTKVSSLCMLGDLQGRVSGGFAQTAWTGVWSDTVIGGSPPADFDRSGHPITTTNAGAITDRWAIEFTNTTAFRCWGELSGLVGTGSPGANFAPVNPATGQPYFSIPAAGWSAGWSPSNVWRFATAGAQAPLWAVRSVAPSAPGGADSVTPEFRGYINV